MESFLVVDGRSVAGVKKLLTQGRVGIFSGGGSEDPWHINFFFRICLCLEVSRAPPSSPNSGVKAQEVFSCGRSASSLARLRQPGHWRHMLQQDSGLDRPAVPAQSSQKGAPLGRLLLRQAGKRQSKKEVSLEVQAGGDEPPSRREDTLPELHYPGGD